MTAVRVRVLRVGGRTRVLRVGAKQTVLRVRQTRHVRLVGYRQGPPGRDGAGGQIVTYSEVVGPGYSGRWILQSPRTANSLEVYLNGLLEGAWHLESNTLVLDATAMNGDEVRFRYLI
jgi:hypothetical protein